MKVNIIVAVDIKHGISKNGIIPWNIPEDMQFFTGITTKNTNSVVIMGKNTWQSLRHKGLKNRINIVISTTLTEKNIIDDNKTKSLVYLVKSFDEALSLCCKTNVGKVFVIGGSKLYEDVLQRELTFGNLIHKIYINQIHNDYACDNFFPHDLYNMIKQCKEYQINNTEIVKICNDPKQTTVTFHSETLKYINTDECNYLKLLKDIMTQGTKRPSRSGNTLSLFGNQIEFDLTNDRFPLLTTKKMFVRGIIEELLFFINGHTDSNILSDKKINIWKQNTSREFLNNRNLQHYDEGDMGPMYGWNLRHFGATYVNMHSDYKNKGYDQLANVINLLQTDPTSRRIMMTTFDPSKVDESVLAPCHGIIIQFYVSDKYLDCKMYQRSVDSALGLPFNIASYAFLMHLLCQITGYVPRRLIMTFGDVHLYESHINEINVQLTRQPNRFPKLVIHKKYDKTKIAPIGYLEQLKANDIEIVNYQSYPPIKLPMSV